MKTSLKNAFEFYEKELLVASEDEKNFPEEEGSYIDI